MDNSRDPLMDMFIFETLQLSDQLEELVLNSEKTNSFADSEINEIFRIMHTIKGSSAMMFINNISAVAHTMEDLFYYLRESGSLAMDYSIICDLVLRGIDFIKEEIAKIQADQDADGSPDILLDKINRYLESLSSNAGAGADLVDDYQETPNQTIEENTVNDVSGSNRFRAVITFEDGCEMENIRAFNVVHRLGEVAQIIQYIPEDIAENDGSIACIREEGFVVDFTADCSRTELEEFLLSTAFVENLQITELDEPEELVYSETDISINETVSKNHQQDTDSAANAAKKQSMIMVQLNKLDQLLDLVGELVISEAMVTRNPDLSEIQGLDNFNKAARHHRKVINELQDVVMSIRMVPLAGTFQKMNRLVRDMSKRLNKPVELEIKGEETEVDKNIIEHLSDPLMHIIRNSIDHGIEYEEERISRGKPAQGTIKLEAKNEGGDVWITIKDDGGGLDKEKILARAMEHGLFENTGAELSEQEIYSFILLPGFSTNAEVTEFSGRGVGMDVVAQNIEEIGGAVHIDSTAGKGTTISLKIPLTLAIIDGMGIRVGDSVYTVPITSIRESFKARENEVFLDPDGQEMIMVRGECLTILRLHELYKIQTAVRDIQDGIIMIAETDNRSICLFADELLGEQQVVVKALPKYLKKVKGIGGCTLLGNGKSSLILDVAGLMN